MRALRKGGGDCYVALHSITVTRTEHRTGNKMASFYSALSPCIGVCQLDPDTGYCIGCLRSGDEIMGWPSASDSERRAILAQLEGRRDAVAPPRRLAAAPAGTSAGGP